RQPERRQTKKRYALDRVHVEVRPDQLEESRDDVDLDVQVLERADEIEHSLVRVLRERDHHALDVEEMHERGQSIQRAEQRQVLEILAPLFRRVVDETEQIDPIFGMLEDLLPDQLADVAGPDDAR